MSELPQPQSGFWPVAGSGGTEAEGSGLFSRVPSGFNRQPSIPESYQGLLLGGSDTQPADQEQAYGLRGGGGQGRGVARRQGGGRGGPATLRRPRATTNDTLSPRRDQLVAGEWARGEALMRRHTHHADQPPTQLAVGPVGALRSRQPPSQGGGQVPGVVEQPQMGQTQLLAGWEWESDSESLEIIADPGSAGHPIVLSSDGEGG